MVTSTAASKLKIEIDLALIIAKGDLLDCERIGWGLRLLAGGSFVLLPGDTDLTLDRSDGCGMIAEGSAPVAA